MLENITQWFADGGTSLVTGLTALGGGLVALKSVWGTMTSLKEALPTSVQEAVDSKMDTLTSTVTTSNTSDSFKLQETVLNCKAKLESTVLSSEVKEQYFVLMTQAQSKLKETYGIVVDIPSSIPTEL